MTYLDSDRAPDTPAWQVQTPEDTLFSFAGYISDTLADSGVSQGARGLMQEMFDRWIANHPSQVPLALELGIQVRRELQVVLH